MGTIFKSATVDVPAPVAWDFLDKYTRSEVHVFENCVSERMVDDFRVVVTQDGAEIWERNVTVDQDRMRAVYAIPGLLGAEHHQAEMAVRVESDGTTTLLWITDMLPDELVAQLDPIYDGLFSDLVKAVTAHEGTNG